MKKLVVTVAAVAVIGVGAFALSSITSAGAQSSSPPASSGAPGQCGARGALLRNALDGLVQKGTITQDQADAVTQALTDAVKAARADSRAGNGAKTRLPRRRAIVDGMAKVAADTIGVTPQDLAQARRDGQSIADVATSKNVDPNSVIKAIVDAGNQRIDAAVAKGAMTQDRATTAKNALPNVADRFVNATGAPGHC